MLGARNFPLNDQFDRGISKDTGNNHSNVPNIQMQLSVRRFRDWRTGLACWGNILSMVPVPVGACGERKLLVTAQYAIDFLGIEAARVLGTPYLIAELELTARQAVRQYLDPGYDTVGTEVAVKHFAATPLGMSVAFHAEVEEVADRRIRFHVWAVDEREKVAEGTHERAIVNVERFGQRVAQKAKSRGS